MKNSSTVTFDSDEIARDSDLVFEDEKQSESPNFDRLMDSDNQENLRLFDAHTKPTLKHSDESADSSEQLGSDELSYMADDIEQFDEDEDESDNDVALPDETQNDDQSQGWLMRNVKRIKRSLDSLWSGAKPAEPKAEGEHNGTKHGKHKKKASAQEKPQKPKNKRKQLTKEERQQRRQQKETAAVAAASTVSHTTTTKRSSSSHKHPAGNTIPTDERKSNKFSGVRPKRQFDTTFDDNEGSGFEGSGENGGAEEAWTFYKMTITIDEPYHQTMSNPRQNSEKRLHVNPLVKNLIDKALQTDFVVRATKFEPYSLNNDLTLVTLEVTAPKDFNLDEMEDRIREQLLSGHNELRPDGLSLVHSYDTDEKIEEVLDPFDPPFPGPGDDGDDEEDDEEEEEDEYTTDRTVDEPVSEPDVVVANTPKLLFDGAGGHTQQTTDLCRGDDKVRCGNTGVYICAIQQCDGRPDCPNGEDENPDVCQKCEKDEFSCDGTRCISGDKVCDGLRDCNDGQDEANCGLSSK
uniref:SEA domain-containing protein n=1 Tax=Anopheles culicifacies TaxID=139723 RepID=A0A182LSG8_9DIPT